MKKIKKSTVIAAKKPQKKIMEFYYMIPEDVTAKDLTKTVTCVDEESVDVWPELNLMEVVLDTDSLILQDGRECFIDPLDLTFIKEHRIKSIFSVSYEQSDKETACRILKQMMEARGGFICSDTETFEPIWTKDTIE